MTGFKYILLHY